MILTIPCIPQIPVQTIVETESGIEYRSKKYNQITNGEQNLIVLPNPVNDEMSVKLLNNTSYIKEINITSLEGKLIQKHLFNEKLSSRNVITNLLNSGIYIVKVIDNLDQEFLNKFVKN